MAFSFRRTITGWLSKHVDNIVKAARSFARKLRPSRRSPSRIDSTKKGTNATIRGNITFSKPAFTRRVTVPPGGFRPKSARAFPMEKPEGIVFRARTHVKNAGKQIEFKGYFSQAIEKEMFENSQEALRVLAYQLALVSSTDIVRLLESRGTGASVRLGGVVLQRVTFN